MNTLIQDSNSPHIAFIGCGNMGASLIGGLVSSGYPADRITGADPDGEKRTLLVNRHRIAAYDDNATAIKDAAAVVLAVKPQTLKDALLPLAGALRHSKAVVISVAAGIRSGTIEGWLGGRAPVVRAMPNTPALIGAGATGLYANPRTSTAQRTLAETILRAVGVTLWLDDESELDAVTVISGSGPAYFFLFIEALEQGGMELGLSATVARQLALQTAYGATRMARESEVDPATLRARVTSPGGTTEQAIKYFIDGDLQGLILKAVLAARDRSREISETYGTD